MGVKVFKPTSAGVRHKNTVDFSSLGGQPEKSLLENLRKSGGRNAHGRITTRHIGGGHRRHYRRIDFMRDKLGIPGVVDSVQYDPNRSAFIALVVYRDGEKRYILAPVGLAVGSVVVADDSADIKPGNSIALGVMPVGTLIHNVEIIPGAGGQIVRSAGVVAQLMGRESDYCLVKLPSGELRRIHHSCRATVGQVSNTDHMNRVIGTAGRKRWLGVRPTVRGVAMNPIDHPHGGGEGKTSGGGHPRTPWGQPTKGYKTRNNKRSDGFIVRRRK